MTIYVPLVTVNVSPRKNAERPAIELTTRSCQCPTYEVPLIKAVWGNLHAETITVVQLPDHVNPLWELLPRDGLDALATEEMRLALKYKKGRKGDVFSQVYRNDELRDAILECSKEANEFLEDAHERREAAENAGAERAAAALIKESTKAVAEGYRKAGPRTARKNPGFKNPEEAPALAGPNLR